MSIVAQTVKKGATEAHERAVALTVADIAAFLRDTLGSKLTAHIASVSDPKMVGKWAEGTKPSAEREARLRDTYQVFQLLLQVEDAYVARAWFIGMNPHLNDEAPADVLREGRAREVIAAARAFRSSG